MVDLQELGAIAILRPLDKPFVGIVLVESLSLRSREKLVALKLLATGPARPPPGKWQLLNTEEIREAHSRTSGWKTATSASKYKSRVQSEFLQLRLETRNCSIQNLVVVRKGYCRRKAQLAQRNHSRKAMRLAPARETAKGACASNLRKEIAMSILRKTLLRRELWKHVQRSQSNLRK